MVVLVRLPEMSTQNCPLIAELVKRFIVCMYTHYNHLPKKRIPILTSFHTFYMHFRPQVATDNSQAYFNASEKLKKWKGFNLTCQLQMQFAGQKFTNIGRVN